MLASALEYADLPGGLRVLLTVFTVLLLLVLLNQWITSRRLRRIERFLSQSTPSVAAERVRERKDENKEHKRLFEEFLNEDPSRRDLPKKEQFAGFRKWRDEKGLNWSS